MSESTQESLSKHSWLRLVKPCVLYFSEHWNNVACVGREGLFGSQFAVRSLHGSGGVGMVTERVEWLFSCVGRPGCRRLRVKAKPGSKTRGAGWVMLSGMVSVLLIGPSFFAWGCSPVPWGVSLQLGAVLQSPCPMLSAPEACLAFLYFLKLVDVAMSDSHKEWAFTEFRAPNSFPLSRKFWNVFFFFFFVF